MSKRITNISEYLAQVQIHLREIERRLRLLEPNYAQSGLGEQANAGAQRIVINGTEYYIDYTGHVFVRELRIYNALDRLPHLNDPDRQYVDVLGTLEANHAGVFQIAGRAETGLCAHLVLSAVDEDSGSPYTNHHWCHNAIGPGVPGGPKGEFRWSLGHKTSDTTSPIWFPNNTYDPQNEHICMETNGIHHLWHTSSVRAERTVGQSINNVTTTIVVWNNDSTGRCHDSRSELNTGTGVFTPAQAIGQTSVYDVKAAIQYHNAAWGAGDWAGLYIYKNGVYHSALDIRYVDAAITKPHFLQGSDTVEMSDGDYLDIRTYHNRGSATSIGTDANRNHLSINKQR